MKPATELFLPQSKLVGTWQGSWPEALNPRSPPPGVKCVTLEQIPDALAKSDTRLTLTPIVWSAQSREALAAVRMSQALLRSRKDSFGDPADRYRPQPNNLSGSTASDSVFAQMLVNQSLCTPNNEAIATGLTPVVGAVRHVFKALKVKGRIEGQGLLFRGYWHTDMNMMSAVMAITPGDGMLAAIPVPSRGQLIVALPRATKDQTWLATWPGSCAGPIALRHHHGVCGPETASRFILNFAADAPVV